MVVNSSGVTVYIGGSNLTITNSVPLAPSESVVFGSGPLYGMTSSGSATVAFGVGATSFGAIGVSGGPASNVNVLNFPSVQPVNGTVSIGNFPSTQQVSEAPISFLYGSVSAAPTAQGSCIKLTSTGNIERCRFIGCSFTTGTNSTGFSAVEISSTATILPTAIDFQNCSVLNTFGTTGTTNGFLINGCQDVSILACRIAGWTNGIQITPSAGSVTKPNIIGCVIGPNGNIAANTTGILLNAGTYGSQTILDNNLIGNTTAITDNTTVTTTANNNRLIKNNQGFNPKSVVAQPAVPASTTAVFNSTGVDCTVFVKGGTLTAITLGGVATGDVVAATASQAYSIMVGANQSLAITYSVAPTWVWIGN